MNPSEEKKDHPPERYIQPQSRYIKINVGKKPISYIVISYLYLLSINFFFVLFLILVFTGNLIESQYQFYFIITLLLTHFLGWGMVLSKVNMGILNLALIVLFIEGMILLPKLQRENFNHSEIKFYMFYTYSMLLLTSYTYVEFRRNKLIKWYIQSQTVDDIKNVTIDEFEELTGGIL